MERQTNPQLPNQSRPTVEQAIFVKDEHIQSNKSQQLHQKIECQEQLLYEEETKPEQKAGQQENYQPLEGYIISKTLGKGNFGKVKLAMHKLTQQYVAVKILEKELIFQNTDIVRITRELKIMKKLRHPFVVQLYEIIETPKQLYLIMEYAQGGDLFQKIVNEERIKQTHAVRIYTQIALGMNYFHSKGVTHRDLKPQNILLSKDGTIKIADFGLGNMFKPGEKLKTACGSPCYASPQMLSREPYDPQKIDIWSSGIILYAMVCGYLPFEDNITTKLYQKIKTASVKLPSWVSSPCRNLIRGLMTKDPKQRFDIETILAHEMISPHAQDLKEIIRERQLTENKIEEICQMYDIEQREKLVSDLNKNRHNNLTTLYYLGIKGLKKMEKQPKKMQQNEDKEDQLSSFSSEGEDDKDDKCKSMDKYEKIKNEQNISPQCLQTNSTKIVDEQKNEQKTQKVEIQMGQTATNETLIVEETNQKDIVIEKHFEQDHLQSISSEMKQNPHIQEQKIQQPLVQNDQNESIVNESKIQVEQSQQMLSDDQIQVHKLHNELPLQPIEVEPEQQIYNLEQNQPITQKQLPQVTQQTESITKSQLNLEYIEDSKLDDSVNMKQSNIHTVINQNNSIIQQSYQLSLEIQQTLEQLNQINRHSQISNQQSQHENVHVNQFHSLHYNQSTNIQQNEQIPYLKIEKHHFENKFQSVQNQLQGLGHHQHQVITSQSEQKLIEQNATQCLKIQQNHQNYMQYITHKQSIQNYSMQQTIVVQSLSIITDTKAPKQPLFEPINQEQLILDHKLEKLSNLTQNDQIEIQYNAKTPQTKDLNTPINIQAKDNSTQSIYENKLIRQNNKKNHLFSAEKVLSQKQQQLRQQENIQKKKDHIKNSQTIELEAKNEIKNILSARNIRLNERSHSKDTPIVFKSNKNKVKNKLQLQKQDKKQKSLSKQKKSDVVNKISDSKAKDNQKQQKIFLKNEKKAVVREKFVIAKDQKPQKKQTLPVKDQTKLKPSSIAHPKQSPLKIINKVESKNRLKTSSLIVKDWKKITNDDIKAKQSFGNEGKEQNVPISPISEVKNKDIPSTFKPIKLGFEDVTKQKTGIKFSPVSQSSQQQKERKKVKISKPNFSNVYNSGKPKSFSQYSNLNSTVSPGSYSKIQVSKVSQQIQINKEKFNKSLESFSYGNKEAANKQKITPLKELQKPQKIHHFGVQSSKNFLKESGLFHKEIEFDDEQTFTINFSPAQPELINPELILFVSVLQLYQLIQSISLLKNINFANIAGRLTVFEYPSKDYMYVVSSNLYKFSQLQSNMKKSPKKSSPTKKKSKIGTFEFVELINSIILKN